MWPVSAHLNLLFRCPGQITSSLTQVTPCSWWDKIKSLVTQRWSVVRTWLPQLDNIQLKPVRPPERLWSWAFLKDSQKLLGSAGKLCCLCKSKGLLQRRLRLAAIVYSQPSYHRDLAENEKAYLKPVVLNTLTWLFEAFWSICKNCIVTLTFIGVVVFCKLLKITGHLWDGSILPFVVKAFKE